MRKTYADIAEENGLALASLPLHLQRQVTEGKRSLVDAVRIHYRGKPFDDVTTELALEEDRLYVNNGAWNAPFRLIERRTDQ